MPVKVRKQIYLEPAQESMLKRIAGVTGVSEAEIIRQAINRHLQQVRMPPRGRRAWIVGRAYLAQLVAPHAPGGARSCMSAKLLVDTNVLVSAYDRTEPQKQQQAIALLDQLVQHDVGVLTTQMLAEFFVTVTRTLAAPLSPADAYTRIEHFLLAWTVYETSGLVVLEAARGIRDHQLSYWDAQIWATARLSMLPVVLSEDFSSGSALKGVRFVNPFDSAFQLDAWLSGYP